MSAEFRHDEDTLRTLLTSAPSMGGGGGAARMSLYGQDESIVELRLTLLLKEIERLKAELLHERRERAVQDLALRHVWGEIVTLRSRVGLDDSAARDASSRANKSSAASSSEAVPASFSSHHASNNSP
mmetsp:Transcript_12563/g.27384  ORF Transcript_12563/g.27384 Transcript_12563/m.27384 type:complete len:128 (+) Transcript_12563:278-661(+)